MILTRIASSSSVEIVYDLSEVHVCSVETSNDQIYAPETSYFGLNIMLKKSRKVYFKKFSGMEKCLNRIITL